ncbi:hypothetical protein ACSQ67_007921 [Phaseolus vulgaris]
MCRPSPFSSHQEFSTFQSLNTKALFVLLFLYREPPPSLVIAIILHRDSSTIAVSLSFSQPKVSSLFSFSLWKVPPRGCFRTILFVCMCGGGLFLDIDGLLMSPAIVKDMGFDDKVKNNEDARDDDTSWVDPEKSVLIIKKVRMKEEGPSTDTRGCLLIKAMPRERNECHSSIAKEGVLGRIGAACFANEHTHSSTSIQTFERTGSEITRKW